MPKLQKGLDFQIKSMLTFDFLKSIHADERRFLGA